MNANCPRCGTTLTYNASDIGGTMQCPKCAALFKVGAGGLSLVAGGAGGAAGLGAAPAAPATSTAGETSIAKALAALEWVSWGLGWLYIPGLFFVLLFVFLPQMDNVSLQNREQAIHDDNAPWKKAEVDLEVKKDKKREEFTKKEKDLEYRLADLDDEEREWKRRKDNVNKETTEAQKEQLDKDRKTLDTNREKYNKDLTSLNLDRKSLNYKIDKEFRPDVEKLDKDKQEWRSKQRYMRMELQQARTSNTTKAWWYFFFRILATIVLMLGAVGYISPKEPPLRRVVGIVTIAAIVLLVAAQLNGGHSVLFGLALLVPPRQFTG